MVVAAVAGLMLTTAGCSEPDVTPAPAEPLVLITPKPTTYEPQEGQFELTADAGIIVPPDDEVRGNVGEYLARILRRSTGFEIPVTQDPASSPEPSIEFALTSDHTLDERYDISISSDGLTVRSATAEGLFRAAQTVRQLFGPDVESSTTSQDVAEDTAKPSSQVSTPASSDSDAGTPDPTASPGLDPSSADATSSPSLASDRRWIVPAATITDEPTYAYRGLMIDIARHFFDKEAIMRQIDLAAGYKINTVHLHLSDDQGWRIEIKAYPALTEIGSLTAVDGDPGGYLTQADFTEIVEYAADRYIEIIPEIDMPGHVNAALVSIPELNPDGIAATPRTDIEVGHSTLQSGSAATYTFVEAVLSELAAISPSEYLHIGGDEADSTSAEDYNFFMQRAAALTVRQGKTPIAWWPNSAGTGAPEGTTIQNHLCFDRDECYVGDWTPTSILSPAQTYLDMKYDVTTPIGLKWRGYVNLETAYAWEPTDLAPAEAILGIESTLWTETIRTQADMDYLLYPRLLANAEVAWSSPQNRDWNDFTARLPDQLERLDRLGVGYSQDY
jgi:hexosaminidase